MENETLLTPDELCMTLKVKKATLRGWIYRDKIDYIKINGCIRFKRSDLTKMIEAGRCCGCTKRRFNGDEQNKHVR